MLGTTRYLEDFLVYYDKASILQSINIQSEAGRDTSVYPGFDDPLMQWIPIYDCVERRYAGFSNALQQVWFGSKNPKRWQAKPEFDGIHSVYTEVEWLWLMLVHRLTGSGASFSHDHGFRNSIIYDMAIKCTQAGEMKQFLLAEMDRGRPVFTSIGNQIPAFPKVPEAFNRYPKQSMYYLGEFAPKLVVDMLDWLRGLSQRATVAATADWACAWNKRYGAKQFAFVLTAWAMDIAEYFPRYVDPYSHCHYGKNALESLNLLFEYKGYKTREAGYEAAMEFICERCRAPHTTETYGRPYSLEDVLCDYVRYIEMYVPKGYEHLTLDQVTNRSLVEHPNKHASYLAIKERTCASNSE